MEITQELSSLGHFLTIHPILDRMHTGWHGGVPLALTWCQLPLQ